jgi:thymidine phosphorylase
VLDVLQGAPAAPADLRARAIEVAGAVLELAGVARPGDGQGMARAVLDDGRAWQKFQRICEAQGGTRKPPLAPLQQPLPAPRTGILTHINNRKLSRLAKLAGAPDDKAAGVELCARLGDTVTATEPLVIVHAEAQGELAYALAYAQANADMFEIET